MKRTISALLLLVMLLSVVPFQTSAASYPEAYNVYFKLQDGTVIDSFEQVSYVNSITVPGYKEVTTWYCQALNMEVTPGEVVWADFDQDENVVFVADSVMPERFTLSFTLPNGYRAASAVLDPENFMDALTVPSVDGTNIPWACQYMTVNSGDSFTGQDLDLDYVWYEKNPTLNFTPAVAPVYPDSFTVRFVDNGQVVSEQVLDFWTYYSGIDIPAGEWYCERTGSFITENDYVSGDTLDIDFDWYGYNPVVVYNASYFD